MCSRSWHSSGRRACWPAETLRLPGLQDQSGQRSIVLGLACAGAMDLYDPRRCDRIFRGNRHVRIGAQCSPISRRQLPNRKSGSISSLPAATNSCCGGTDGKSYVPTIGFCLSAAYGRWCWKASIAKRVGWRCCMRGEGPRWKGIGAVGAFGQRQEHARCRVAAGKIRFPHRRSRPPVRAAWNDRALAAPAQHQAG